MSFVASGELPVLERQRSELSSQFAIVPVGRALSEELAIYIELDAWHALHCHANQDREHELGGILLGQACRDPDQGLFVVVNRTLPAQHSRSTPASFTFTHETWRQVCREVDSYRGSYRIVGWYHTHPGCGVFLSAADAFICRHYFCKPTDLAIVVDPCTSSLAVFGWNGLALQPFQGFYLIAPLNEKKRLEEYVDCIREVNCIFFRALSG